jgi:ADP-ribosylglycohydrolase
MTLPHDYLERVYAGVLGKMIGVYLGRPFEHQTYEQIAARLGDINYYVNDRVHEVFRPPLVVTDDDLSGTFTFLRALPDFGDRPDLTPEQIGQAWLNYIVEGRTILWWGGLGASTEHTAYLRLKRGIPAPRSGSAELNGPSLAEQIGAQIFVDGWAMVAPGDPELAADFARCAASVSHDGEAVFGAQVLAAMEAQAFVESDLDALIETGLRFIPRDSQIARMIADIRDWRASEPDWRVTRARIAAQYGYDRYLGFCPLLPNHALIWLGLLYGEGDFHRSLMIVNTSGWDTDCNSGNLGCLLGIRNGLAAFEGGLDWRGPVADRLYLSTADGGRAITDAVIETYHIVNSGRALQGEPPLAPKDGAHFHFELPNSVQGFRAEADSEYSLDLENAPDHRDGVGSLRISRAGLAQVSVATYIPLEAFELPGSGPVAQPEAGSEKVVELRNVVGHSRRGARSLSIRSTGATRITTPTFIPPEALEMRGYAFMASPTLYSGQSLSAGLSADESNLDPITVSLYVRAYGPDDLLVKFGGPAIRLTPGEYAEAAWRVPDTGGAPIAEVGLEMEAAGTIYLDYLTWGGAPTVSLTRPVGSGLAWPGPLLWRRAWVNGVDQWEASWREPYPIVQNNGRGLISQGTREWTDYQASAEVTPALAEACGLGVRVQGMRRYYALLLCAGGLARLVKVLYAETVLAEAAFEWEAGRSYSLRLQAEGPRLRGWIDGRLLFEVVDSGDVLDGGGVALICEEGHLIARAVSVSPPDSKSLNHE